MRILQNLARTWEKQGWKDMNFVESFRPSALFCIFVLLVDVSFMFHVTHSFPLSSITLAYNQKKPPPYVLVWFFFVSCNFALTRSMYNDVRNL